MFAWFITRRLSRCPPQFPSWARLKDECTAGDSAFIVTRIDVAEERNHDALQIPTKREFYLKEGRFESAEMIEAFARFTEDAAGRFRRGLRRRRGNRSREAGCNGHLVKPANLPDLQQLLAELRR